MNGLLRLAPLPSLTAFTLLQAILPNIATVLGLAGISAIIGGCLIVGYYKAAADKGEKLLSLAADETKILSSRVERLEKENAVLAAQPNLERHAELLEKLIERVETHDAHTKALAEMQTVRLHEEIDLLKEIRRAVVPAG